MTRDDLIAKWAGMAAREREAWVAEAVFGHTVGRERRIGGEIFIADANAPHGFQRAVPRYTTDISAAWTVFEILRRDWLPGIQDCAMFGYRVDLQSDHEHRADIVGVVAETAPEAICLAGLLAKLTEVSADV